jgi:hypothetical protein
MTKGAARCALLKSVWVIYYEIGITSTSLFT